MPTLSFSYSKLISGYKKKAARLSAIVIEDKVDASSEEGGDSKDEDKYWVEEQDELHTSAENDTAKLADGSDTDRTQAARDMYYMAHLFAFKEDLQSEELESNRHRKAVENLAPAS